MSMQQNQRYWLFYFRRYSSLSKLDPYITHNSNSQLTSPSEIHVMLGVVNVPSGCYPQAEMRNGLQTSAELKSS